MKSLYQKSSWPYSMYVYVFKQTTGCERLTDEETEFLEDFSDSRNSSSSKALYSHALFMMRRFYPLFIIRWALQKKLKNMCIKENAPKSILSIHKEFAEIILNDAMKHYGRSSAK